MASTQGSQADIVRRDKELQAERSAARKSRKQGRAGAVKVEAKPVAQVSEEALHALFRKAQDVRRVSESPDFRGRTPKEVYISRSHEFFKAARQHGLIAAILRVRKAFGSEDFVPPVELTCLQVVENGESVKTLLPIREAVVLGIEALEAKKTVRLDLAEDMCYVLVITEDGKDTFEYIPGMQVMETRVKVHNAKVRDRDGKKAFKFEIFAIKEEAMAFLKKNGAPLPRFQKK